MDRFCMIVTSEVRLVAMLPAVITECGVNIGREDIITPLVG